MTTNKHLNAIEWLATHISDSEMIQHYVRVADRFSDRYDTWLVALLHDVVEDGVSDMDTVKSVFQLSDTQINVLEALTRRSTDETYMDYIERVSHNPIAVEIKLSDLTDNIRRCAADLPNYHQLLPRYAKAYSRLLPLIKPK